MRFRNLKGLGLWRPSEPRLLLKTLKVSKTFGYEVYNRYRGGAEVSIVNRVVTHWSDLTDLDNSTACFITFATEKARSPKPQFTVHCRLVVRKVWGIGGYHLSYGLHNCMDCIGHERIGFLRSL